MILPNAADGDNRPQADPRPWCHYRHRYVPQEELGKDLMDRDQARTDYRRILAGVVRHHQALDRHVTGAAMARVAKRLGLRSRVASLRPVTMR